MKGITTIKNLSFTGAAVLLASTERSNGFVLSPSLVTFFAPTHLSAHPGKAGGGGGPGSSVVDSPPDTGFIATELRGAAMRLHTRAQAPKEGEREVPKEPAKPYVPTHMDYLKFLVDSRHVYAALEDIVNEMPELEVYRNNGLERVKGLDIDIEWMASEYDLEIPQVGNAGLSYAEKLRDVAKDSVPAFMCHYYNYYFAHTAGGRMIGLQMASLLLNKKTLEFYKWGDLNAIKAKVKGDIEDMADKWSREEKDDCVDQTAAAFMGGGAINGYLSGGRPGH